MSAYSSLLSPLTIGPVTLKNRVASTAHAPGLAENGRPGERYQLYHEEKARGGIGLTMFGGSSNISRDSGSIYGQIYVGDDAIVPHFRQFAARIHKHGAALMCQITHMGRRTVWNGGDWIPTLAPSVVRDPAHHAVPREATTRDIARIVRQFGDAAWRCREGGLDGCEILATTHLLGQFLSPLSNRRRDAYGGSLENRARFLCQVIEEVRERVGPDFLVSVRFAADESNEDGLSPEEGIGIGRLIGRLGGVDFLNVNGAYGGTTPGLADNIPNMTYRTAPYIELARRVREASGLPVLMAARLSDPATADFAISQGYLDLAGMVRPHIADPHIVRKLAAGEGARIRPCVGASLCLDRVYAGGEALCIQNASTAREGQLPHEVPKAGGRRRVVVVGAGPAGLEAARVSALRGHEVTLFEAGRRPGGQVLLAAAAACRRDMIGIVDWLAAEVAHLGVDLRLDAYAEAGDVLALRPDVVIAATGGVPMMDLPGGGAELAVSTWDVLGGQARLAGETLLVDETGDHGAASVALELARAGVRVEFATPDRHVGRLIGGGNAAGYLRGFYEHGVKMTPDHRLVALAREGNRLRARLRNDQTRAIVERVADHVVLEQGTSPADALFRALAPGARNLGETDVEALCAGAPQPGEANPQGGYMLFALGDAVASRDIHAAIYDAKRICVTL